MHYKIIVRFDGTIQETLETTDSKVAWQFIHRWFRKSANYVGVTMTFESRKD